MIAGPYRSLSRFLFLCVCGAAGCSMGESGILPPFDTIFLPTGLAADPKEDLVFVVNSNSDLRFNAGTLAVVDVKAAENARVSGKDIRKYDRCTKTRFSRLEPVPDDYCCWDLLDSTILNCKEAQFIDADSTIQIGSFGGSVVIQPYEKDGELFRRLFMAIRSEPSITFADFSTRQGRHTIQCTGSHGVPPSSTHAYCSDAWRIRRPTGALPGAFALAEEPHFLSLDLNSNALYIGHLSVTVNAKVEGGGVSSLDLCNPEMGSPPRFAGRSPVVFPDQSSQAVANLSSSTSPNVQVFATARYSTGISPLVFRTEVPSCTSTSATRDLSLVPVEEFNSSAFLPAGADIRGILFSEDLDTAYVLHRNAGESMYNTAALVKIDRKRLANGQRSNRATDVLKICNGPTQMQFHDVGGGREIYVTCYDDGQVYVVDPVAWKISSVIDVGGGPNNLVFSSTRKTVAFIASYAHNVIAVIDLAPESVTRNRVVLRIGLPHGNTE